MVLSPRVASGQDFHVVFNDFSGPQLLPTETEVNKFCLEVTAVNKSYKDEIAPKQKYSSQSRNNFIVQRTVILYFGS